MTVTIVSGLLSIGPDCVLADGATVTVPETAVVKDASGKVIGRVLSAEVRDGHIYATMEVEDMPRSALFSTDFSTGETVEVEG